MSVQDCIIGGIATYVPSPTNPWDRQKVQHLYNRLGFGATDVEIAAALSQNPDTLIDNLIDNAVASPSPTPPIYANWTSVDYPIDDTFFDVVYDHLYGLIDEWIIGMLNNPVRYKMVLFWHNHFVTQFEEYFCSNWMWQYYDLLHQYAFGNFKDFVYDMGKNPAMLDFLDNNENIADFPNENYARELLELFTLGEGNNYTQADIFDTARALTGWKAYDCDNVYFDVNDFDNNPKTIFGQTGNWGYDDVHNILFAQRENEMAHYIAEKLYRYFVYPEANATIINAVANDLIANNFNIASALKLLIKSEHFFDDKWIGGKIKSPLELYVQTYRLTKFQYGVNITDNEINGISYRSADTGQQLFSPINVAGWPGQRSWITEHLMVKRWSHVSNSIMWPLYNDALPNAAHLVQLAKDLSNYSSDPAVITQAFIDHYLSVSLSAEATATATDVFKAGVPLNYYDSGVWGLDYPNTHFQVANLITHLAQLPEYQLI